jgi:hypothetical protein
MDVNLLIFSMLCGAGGGVIIFIIFLALRNFTPKEKKKEIVLSCPKCKSNKVKPTANDPNGMICTKCFTLFPKSTDVTLIPAPPIEVAAVKKFICKYCQKELDSEFKLRKHIGMSHSDKIEI